MADADACDLPVLLRKISARMGLHEFYDCDVLDRAAYEIENLRAELAVLKRGGEHG